MLQGVPASPAARGVEPPPYAVLFVSRAADVLGDGAANSGCIFIGLHQQPPALHAIAWFCHHGFTYKMRLFPSEAAAFTAYPQAHVGVGYDVRAAGRDIIERERAAADEAAALERAAAAEAAALARERAAAAEAAVREQAAAAEAAVLLAGNAATEAAGVAADDATSSQVHHPPLPPQDPPSQAFAATGQPCVLLRIHYHLFQYPLTFGA